MLESPLDYKKIQPVHPKGNQSWVFIGRTDAKAETPVLWPPHAKSWLIGKDSNAGRDWGQEKGMPEDEMAGWHHWLNGHEFEWTPGVGDGQEGLARCISWGRKESDTTERLNWTELSSRGYCSHQIVFKQLHINQEWKLQMPLRVGVRGRQVTEICCLGPDVNIESGERVAHWDRHHVKFRFYEIMCSLKGHLWAEFGFGLQVLDFQKM